MPIASWLMTISELIFIRGYLKDLFAYAVDFMSSMLLGSEDPRASDLKDLSSAQHEASCLLSCLSLLTLIPSVISLSSCGQIGPRR